LKKISYFIFGKSYYDNILKYNIVAGLGEYDKHYKKPHIAISLSHISFPIYYYTVTSHQLFHHLLLYPNHSRSFIHLPLQEKEEEGICLLLPPPPQNLPQFPAKPFVSPAPVASSLLGWLSSSWRKAILLEEPCETQVKVLYLIP